MSTSYLRVPVRQATPFQRFTIRLVDGRFVRVPKSDLPSVEPQVDKTLTSNQTEIRELCRLVNGRFVVIWPEREKLLRDAGDCPPRTRHRDPAFDLPA